MDMMTVIVILLAVVALAAVAAAIVMANKLSSLTSARSRREAEAEESRRRMEELERRLTEEVRDLRRQTAGEFRDIASAQLDAASRRLRADSSRELDSILAPLKQQIAEFRKAVSDSYVADNATRKSLSDQIERLVKLNMTIGDEARNLATALKGNSKVQGDWGEMVLETLLENAGLQRGVNFHTQVGSDASGMPLVDSETGRRQRPDVVITLPDRHCMVVDSKVSLTAWLDLMKAEETGDSQGRGAALKRHLDSVRRHIDELAAKNYQNTVRDAAEHVLMFIPNEGAYLAAVQGDGTLWKYAYDRKVVIVSPTHIFSVMQIVSQLWRQENQNRNAERIADLGGLLHDKFVAFIADFEKIDRQLQAVHATYDKCHRSLTSGGTSLVSRARRLRDLGARTSRQLPDIGQEVGDDEG